jgi:hypothetical protein
MPINFFYINLLNFCGLCVTKGWKEALPRAVKELSPHLRMTNPGFNPEFTSLLYDKCGGERRVKPGVWHPELWSLAKDLLFVKR